nr:initiation-specific alpha-1,6-mannosyltransferase [Quercus suber]
MLIAWDQPFPHFAPASASLDATSDFVPGVEVSGAAEDRRRQAVPDLSCQYPTEARRLLGNLHIDTLSPGTTYYSFAASSPSARTFSKMTFRTRIITVCTILLLLGTFGRYSPTTPTTKDLAAWTSKFQKFQQPRKDGGWPRKIWQTWRSPVANMGDELRWFAETWPKLNPDYRYELMIDDQALTFVRENYQKRPDIIRMFEGVVDSQIRADYLRYLMVLAEGGVYADIDLSCEKSIDEWIPEQYRNQTGFVVGVSYDARGGDVPEGYMAVQLCQWAFMAKKGNTVLQHVVDRLTLAVENYQKPKQNPWDGPNIDDIIHARVRISLSTCCWQMINRFSFASGQSHSGSKEWGNDQELVAHHWKGFFNWRHRLGIDE